MCLLSIWYDYSHRCVSNNLLKYFHLSMNTNESLCFFHIAFGTRGKWICNNNDKSLVCKFYTLLFEYTTCCFPQNTLFASFLRWMCIISTLLTWSVFYWLVKSLLKRSKLTILETHNKNYHFFTLKYVFYWLYKVSVYTLFKTCQNIIKITWTVFFRCFWRPFFSRTSKLNLPNLKIVSLQKKTNFILIEKISSVVIICPKISRDSQPEPPKKTIFSFNSEIRGVYLV